MSRIIAPLKLPRQEQHDRIFLQDAINRYKNRLLTAAGYIYTIVKIYRQSGHRLNIPHPRSFYEYFQIPKSTFYRALIQLENAEEIGFRWEPMGGISMWWEGEPAPQPEPAPQRLNQLPVDTRSNFEQFVRSQWKNIRGEEIRSFPTFVEKAANFKAWWEKFRQSQQPVTHRSPNSIEPATYKFAADDDRPSGEQIRQLRQLLASKK